MLLRVFGVDVLKCSGCGSRMPRIAVILLPPTHALVGIYRQPKVIQDILACLNAKGGPP